MILCQSCNGNRYQLSFQFPPQPIACKPCGGSGAVLTPQTAKTMRLSRRERLRLIVQRVAARREANEQRYLPR